MDAEEGQARPTAGKSWPDQAHTLRLVALIAITGLISAFFLGMVQPYISALILAAISAIMAGPLFQWFQAKTSGKTGLASGLTLLVVVSMVVAPLVGIGILAAGQAITLAEGGAALIEHVRANPSLLAVPDWVPFRAELIEAEPEIMAKLGEIAGAVAGFLVSSLSALTRGTANFFLNFFVFLYALFMFLQMKVPALRQVLAYTGLKPETQDLLAERMVSISRATIKGTILIGVIQGALGGLGFWFVDIEGFAFWAVIMMIASVIPAVGAGLVVMGGAIYLGIEGQIAEAIGLALWGGVVVGMVDNLLRPVLVGRDAKMDDILILISTLGGLSVFGIVGLVLGPVLAGLFVAIWTTVAEMMTEGTGGELTPKAVAEQTTATSPPPVPKTGGPTSSRSRTPGRMAKKSEFDVELEDLRKQLAQNTPHR